MASSKKNMNIFTNRFANNPTQPKTNTFTNILDSISTTGTATSNIRIIIGDNTTNKEILEFSFGQPRIKRSVEKKFRLVSSVPDVISHRASEIKCCLCNSVIHFNQQSAWYYTIRYTAKHFYYFVCLDSSSPDKPTCKCYKPGESK